MQQLLCQNPTIMNRDMWTHQVSQWTPAKSPPARPRCTPPAIPRCPPERPALPHTAPQRRPSLAATSGYLDFLFLIENETVTDDEEVAMAIALAQLQCKQQVTVPSLGFRDLYACSVRVGCCDCCNIGKNNTHAPSSARSILGFTVWLSAAAAAAAAALVCMS
jgi:hypothetical protein